MTPVLGIDSHWSVILVYMSWVTLHIWTIKGYFDSVDPALDKAAQIDGATPWQTFRHVFLPLAVPMIAVVFVLSFIGIINDYPIASVLLGRRTHSPSRSGRASTSTRSCICGATSPPPRSSAACRSPSCS